MTREIKFRAWDNKYPKMCRVASVDWEHGTALIATRGVITYHNRAFTAEYDKLLGDLESCELMQYTGLHDKNGRDIYEGDIVKTPDRSHGTYLFREQPTKLQKVYWQEKVGIWSIAKMFGHDPDNFEVVGNIWEDGDLLDGQKTKKN